MAATAITPTQITPAGVNTPTAVACDNTNGNTVPNSGQLMLRFKNTDTASHTVTFTPANQVDGQSFETLVVTVPASGDVSVAGLSVNVFGATLAFLANSALVEYIATLS